MSERNQLQNRESDKEDKSIHDLTGRYISGLKGLPGSRLLQIRMNYPSIATRLKIKSPEERVEAEKDKFEKRLKGYIEGFKRFLPPGEDNSMGVFTRIVCVTAGEDLIVAANQTFDEFPYFRNPLVYSARDTFLYGVHVSKEYGEEIDQYWLNGFILDVVMQSAETWKAGGREEFPERIAQFREPRLVT